MTLERKKRKGAQRSEFHIDKEPLILKLKGDIKDGCLFLPEMHCFFFLFFWDTIMDGEFGNLGKDRDRKAMYFLETEFQLLSNNHQRERWML